MSKDNNEFLLIKTIYFTKNSIIGEKILSHQATFGDIIYHFNTNFKTEFLNINKNYKYNGKSLNENTLIKDLIKIPKGKSYIIFKFKNK